MPVGGQPGNKNAVKGKRYEGALWHELCAMDIESGAESGATLRKIARTQIISAIGGDIPAAKEIADRLDGKPAQAITGADGGALQVVIQATSNDEKI